MSSFLPEGFDQATQGQAQSLQQGESSTDLATLSQVKKLLGVAAKYPQQSVDLIMPYIIDAIQVSNLQIPASQVPGYNRNVPQTVATTVDVANTVTETDLLNSSITLAQLTASSVVRASLFGDILYNRNSADTVQIKVKLGATTVLDTGAFTLLGGVNVSRAVYDIRVTVVNLASVSSQVVTLTGGASVGTQSINAGGGADVYGFASTGAVDTSAAQTLKVTLTWSFASASNSFRNRTAIIETL